MAFVAVFVFFDDDALAVVADAGFAFGFGPGLALDLLEGKVYKVTCLIERGLTTYLSSLGFSSFALGTIALVVAAFPAAAVF